MSGRVARIASAILLLAAVGYLQVVLSERALVFCLRAYLLIAGAALIGLLGAKPTATPLTACLWATGIFFAYLISRSLLSPEAYLARFDLYLLLATIAVYAIAALVFTSSGARIAIVISLLSFGVVHVVFSLVQSHLAENFALIFPSLGNLEYRERGAGLYVNPDHLAGFLEIVGALGLGVACWSRRPNWFRVIAGYLTAVCYLGLALTGSRGGYLSGATSVLVFAILSLFVLKSGGRYYIAKFGGIGFIIFVVAAAATYFFFQHNPRLSSRAGAVFEGDPVRVALWQTAIDEWRLAPVFGTGSGTYMYYGRQFRPESLLVDPGDVHNDYLTLLAEYGCVGAIAFAIFLLAHLRAGWMTLTALGPKRIALGSSLRSDRLALTIGALCATAAYAVHSAVDFNLHVPPNALTLAFVFGMLGNPGIKAETAPTTFSARLRLTAGLAAVILLVQSARLLPGEYYAEEARAALRDENFSEAIRFAQTALHYESHNPNIFSYLGSAHRALAHATKTPSERLPEYEGALNAFAQAHKLAPLDGTWPLYIGMLYDELGQYSEAEWMYDLALARDSVTTKPLYTLHLRRWENSGEETTR